MKTSRALSRAICKEASHTENGRKGGDRLGTTETQGTILGRERCHKHKKKREGKKKKKGAKETHQESQVWGRGIPVTFGFEN